MGNLNKVMIIGNTGRDAELRYTANGTAVSDFSMAVNSRRRSQSGDWEDETEWFQVVLFGDRAERISQYITKGKQLYVEGRLRTRNWDDDQGVRHYRTEVIANNVEFLDRRGESGGGGGDWSGGGGNFGGGGAGGAGSRGSAPSDLDDLPFE
ncbi:MAG: single-stranded DNA-binding protein [Chloroflexi bacterium]|nr:single-stranded DNA-binding protein [Chloroflexota bacterium]